MSVTDRVLHGLRRIPRGFSADGRQLGLGLAAALDNQRARGAEPLERDPGHRPAAGRPGRVTAREQEAGAAR